jgi:hypothetical protein
MMRSPVAAEEQDAAEFPAAPQQQHQHQQPTSMTAQRLVQLLEEMMDLKLQQNTEMHLKVTPDVARILHEKRETDRRRLEQIRHELVRFLES